MIQDPNTETGTTKLNILTMVTTFPLDYPLEKVIDLSQQDMKSPFTITQNTRLYAHLDSSPQDVKFPFLLSKIPIFYELFAYIEGDLPPVFTQFYEKLRNDLSQVIKPKGFYYAL